MFLITKINKLKAGVLMSHNNDLVQTTKYYIYTAHTIYDDDKPFIEQFATKAVKMRHKYRLHVIAIMIYCQLLF